MTDKILITDDSNSMRQIVRFTLEEAGYEVVEASDGKKALEIMQDSKFNAMITDLNMPNLNGIDLIRSVRADEKHKFMPIIMLTTEFHDSKKQEAKLAGATGWIIKPFTRDQLLTAVKRVISNA